jgi:hypothetical protein
MVSVVKSFSSLRVFKISSDSSTLTLLTFSSVVLWLGLRLLSVLYSVCVSYEKHFKTIKSLTLLVNILTLK